MHNEGLASKGKTVNMTEFLIKKSSGCLPLDEERREQLRQYCETLDNETLGLSCLTLAEHIKSRASRLYARYGIELGREYYKHLFTEWERHSKSEIIEALLELTDQTIHVQRLLDTHGILSELSEMLAEVNALNEEEDE